MVCNCYLPPRRLRHRLSIEIGYAYRFALSSSSKYVFAKQPSTPEVYSTSTDNAMNLNPLDIHISHRGMAAISWRHENVTKNWAPDQMFWLYCQFKTPLNSSLIIYFNKKIKLIISDCCLSFSISILFLTFSKQSRADNFSVTSADGCQASVGNVNVAWIKVHSIVSVYPISMLNRCRKRRGGR